MSFDTNVSLMDVTILVTKDDLADPNSLLEVISSDLTNALCKKRRAKSAVSSRQCTHTRVKVWYKLKFQMFQAENFTDNPVYVISLKLFQQPS